MLKKLICVSLLATAAAPSSSFARDKRDGAAPGYTGTCSVVPEAGFSSSPRRIDLHFEIAAPVSAGIAPTVTAHAINTKGTGMAGRVSGISGASAKVSCTGTAAAPDRTGRRGAGWSCAVTGTDEAPQFTLGLLLQPPAGQSSKWSFGESHSGMNNNPKDGAGRVSIVPRGIHVPSAAIIACSSSTKGSGGYDMIISKKG